MKYPKHQYVRSKALMKAYRTIPCQLCGIEDGTVAGAHMNSAKGHKGLGIKADDSLCASLCARCHSMIDSSYRLSGEERAALWDEAYRKTEALLRVSPNSALPAAARK
jgi:hypothetical protein